MKHLLTLLLFISTSVFSYEKALICSFERGKKEFLLKINNNVGTVKIIGSDEIKGECNVKSSIITCSFKFDDEWANIEISRMTGEFLAKSISLPNDDIKQLKEKSGDKGKCQVAKQKF